MRLALLSLLAAAALAGCVSQERYAMDKANAQARIAFLYREVRELNEAVAELRRGYKIIPVKVIITNAVDSAESTVR